MQPWALSGVWFLVAILLSGCELPADQQGVEEGTIQGIVVDKHGPLSGATVRVQTTATSVATNTDGFFRFDGLHLDDKITVSAFRSGYFIGGGEEITPGRFVEIQLVAHAAEDNASYDSISPYKEKGGPKACENCHASLDPDEMTLSFDQWKEDVHAKTATNPRFLSMYGGTDLEGNQSSATRYARVKDYGSIPLPPDSSMPYYGPGYRLDFPNTAGNCAACHVPVAAIDYPYDVDPRAVSGAAKDGITCDFCHKVWDATLDANTGMPRAGMPGVLSFEYRRPPQGKQFFGGPLDDVAPGEDTFVAIYQKSEFCAACHTAKFWSVQIYNSFGEWLASPYKNTDTCQSCHMPRTDETQFVRTESGGRQREPGTISNHLMRGPEDNTFLRETVVLETTASIEGGELTVSVKATNATAGHHMPTGSPLRHLILLVSAETSDGQVLAQAAGSRVPTWGGVGDPNKGYYAGLPGKIFAKVLKELWTHKVPTAAYWNRTEIVSDNRLAALASDISEYTFEATGIDSATVTAQLVYRRAYIELKGWKKWTRPDLPMAEKTTSVKAENSN